MQGPERRGSRPAAPGRRACTLHRASAQDLDGVMALEAQGFVASVRESRTTFERRIDVFPDGFLVARDPARGELAGYVASELWRWEPRPGAERFTLGHAIDASHDPQGRELYLSSMVVATSWRGAGLGARLLAGCLDAVCQAHPQVDHALLLVNESWRAARRIYEDLGFVAIDVLPDFFVDPSGPAQAGVVMRRRLRGGAADGRG